MEILRGIEARDLSIYLRQEKVLIISDVHMGYEEALNKKGIMVPRFQFEETKERLRRILDGLMVEKIVINGDLKHEFGGISRSEWDNTLELLEFLSGYSERIVLIRGNHDVTLDPIAGLKNLEIVDHLRVGRVYLCHGDIVPEDAEFKESEVVIIGHEHPAIGVGTNVRMETFKCFLLGNFEKNKKLIVMPSFNLVTEGTDVLREKVLSPFLKGDLSGFSVFVVSDKIYGFGKVSDVRDLRNGSGDLVA